MLRIICYISFVLLTSCYSAVHAPVEELKPQYALNQPQNYYIVRTGDTLYAIAFLFNQNIQELARINRIPHSYIVKVGQRLLIKPQSNVSRRSPAKRVFFKRIWSKWHWPTQGQLIRSGGQDSIAQKGITIKGHFNQAVYAAQSGTIAYAGNGLPGYGNLILIMHANQLISAYAYNAKVLVREGQYVEKGQLIARMGYMDRNIAALHFEVRHRGQAQNPLNYLA